MKRWILVACLGFFAVGLSGCMELESRYYIYPDGSGKMAGLFSLDPVAMISAMGSMAGTNKTKAATGTDTDQASSVSSNPSAELEKMGISGISKINTTVTVYYNDILKFKEAVNQKKAAVKELVWEKKDNLYHLKLVSDMSKLNEPPALSGKESEKESPSPINNPANKGMALMLMQGMKFSFVLVMPGKVVKSNGKAEGREVRWELTGNGLMNEPELIFEAFSEMPGPELNEEIRKFKEESSAANKKLKEAVASFAPSAN
ncbi:MAG: hypothetical protein NTY10_05950 [Candidatus Omnitrophica bacterium]|nr:hypothetical protein [Candidatus Omnitrophota bacterium]